MVFGAGEVRERASKMSKMLKMLKMLKIPGWPRQQFSAMPEMATATRGEAYVSATVVMQP